VTQSEGCTGLVVSRVERKSESAPRKKKRRSEMSLSRGIIMRGNKGQRGLVTSNRAEGYSSLRPRQVLLVPKRPVSQLGVLSKKKITSGGIFSEDAWK